MSVKFGNDFVAGNLALKVQDRIYVIKRTVENGVEFYTAQIPSTLQLSITTASRYAFVIEGTNTTTNPRLRVGSQVFLIKNNLGNSIAVGDLINGAMEEMYCLDVNSNEVRMRSGITSYNSLTDKPTINGNPLTNGSTYEQLGLAKSSTRDSDSILSIETENSYDVSKVGQRTIGDTSFNSFIYGNKDYAVILESSQKPYWNNGVSYTQLATKADLDAIYIPDNYKGFVNYAVEYFNDLAAFVAEDNDAAFVTSESSKYRYTNSSWKKVEIVTPHNGDYYEVEQFSNGLNGRIIYSEADTQWNYFKDSQGIPDNITIKKDAGTNLIHVLKVPNSLDITVNGTAYTYDGSSEININITPSVLGVPTTKQVSDSISDAISNLVTGDSSITNGNVITYNPSTKALEGTSIKVSEIVTGRYGKLYATTIAMSPSNATLINTTLDNCAKKSGNNTFSGSNVFSGDTTFSTSTFNGKPIVNIDGSTQPVALESELYDDSNTLTVLQQTWSDSQKAQARANIGAGTSSFNGNYNSLSNRPSIDGVQLTGNITKKSLGIYPAPVIAKDGNDEVVSDNENLTVQMVRNLLNHDDEYVVSLSTAQSWFAGLSKFEIHHAYINGVMYTHFTTFQSPVNFETLRYNRIRYITNDDGTVQSLEDTFYFDLNSSEGNIIYKVKSPDLIDPSVTNLLTVPVAMQVKEPYRYQFSDTYIVNGGNGYSINDVVYASTFPIKVIAVNSAGSITAIEQFSDDVKNEEREVDYAGDYTVTGGSGTGAVLRLRTHYAPGDFVNIGHLSSTTDSDPLVQESFVLGQIKDSTQLSTYYDSGRVNTTSKFGFNELTNSVEMSYDVYSDNNTPVNTTSMGLLLGTVGNKTGAFLRNSSNYGMLTTEQDVSNIIGTTYAGTYMGEYTYFSDKNTIISQSASENDTAITNDTFETGKYSSGAWTWSTLTVVNGSYADVLNLLDNPTTSGYSTGTVKLHSVGDEKSWIVKVNAQGTADGITLIENPENGTVGFRFDGGFLSGANGSNIRISSDGVSIKSYIDNINTSLSEEIDSSTENKMDIPSSGIVENRLILGGTNNNIKNADFVVSDVMRLSTTQTVSGNKTFSGTQTFNIISASTINTDTITADHCNTKKANFQINNTTYEFSGENSDLVIKIPNVAKLLKFNSSGVDFYDTPSVNGEDIATQSWVTSRGYLTSIPSTYATQSWVQSQGYLTSIPNTYALKTDVESIVTSKGYITSAALDGYATQSWVGSQNYLTSVPAGYATQTWVNSQGFATQDWVTSKGYSTTDSNVMQSHNASNATFPLLFSSKSTSSTSTRTTAVLFNNNVKINPSTGELWATKIYNAVFNDYAEYRKSRLKVAPGKIVVDGGNDEVKPCVTKRNKGKLFAVTDTYGTCMGDKEGSVPVALAGRVLVYVEDKHKLKVGDYIGCNKNAIGRKISKLEAFLFPNRVLGTVSSIPDYDEWGKEPFKVKVNGRVWINVR